MPLQNLCTALLPFYTIGRREKGILIALYPKRANDTATVIYIKVIFQINFKMTADP